jgi:glycosyltransferase involved in cell wall biosynthesis
MKISIVLPNLKFGGAERLHLNLAKEWSENGHKVEFVLMNKEGELLSIVHPNVRIVSLGVYRLKSIVLPLSAHIRNSKPDIILVAMWPLTSLSIVSWIMSGKRGKIFLSEHVHLTSAISNEIHTSKLLLRLTILLTYRFANGIISVSEGVKKNLSLIGYIDRNKIRVIYNPIVFNKSRNKLSNYDRHKLWKSNSTYNILSVGELKTQKDHENLIEAFSLLPDKLDVKLVILGDGHLKDYLSSLISNLDLSSKISIQGFVHDPYPWYCSSDLFVLSSKWEGFGNVIVEALECGIPVVSTDCPSGPKEILDNGRYGELVPVGNPVALCDAIYSNLKKHHNKEELMSRSKDFLVSNISSQYVSYFLES